ncbi:MAG: hypothetical protein EHM23_32220 [Acidobacteria bacterium]|nr:MAG: hypothetical protein EHM23_32220 [Acidobacteriota bacterium]
MKRTFFPLVVLLFLLVAGETPAQDLSFKVVVNNANATSVMSKDQISKLFLKKVTAWQDGREVVPVDLSERSQVRETFSREIHDRPVAAVKSYWQQQVFSGRSTPPATRDSDGETLAFVQQNPGAIGYVSAAAAINGVRVINVTR